jgi:hypothetical protein
MKALLAILLLIAVPIQDAPALARSSNASPLIGSWAVDVSRLPIPPEARPQRVTFTFSDAGNGKWATQVDIVDAAGAKSHAEGTAALDGTPAPVKGSLEADVTAVKMPAPNVLVMQLGKGGNPASTRVYTVAADGKSMIEIAAYFGDGGVPVMRTNHFTRVR